MKTEEEIKEWISDVDEMLEEYRVHLKTAPPDELEDFDIEEISNSMYELRIEKGILEAIIK